MPSDFATPSRWAAIRDACVAARELMIIAAVAAFLLMPQRVQKFLSDSGIRSVAGVEFDLQKFKDAQSELRLAQADLQSIQQALDEAGQVLGQAGPPAATAPVGEVMARSQSERGDASARLSPTLWPSLGALPSAPDQALGTTNTMAAADARANAVSEAQQILQAARQRGQSIERRLERADRMSRQAVPGQILASPEALFGNRSVALPDDTPRAR